MFSTQSFPRDGDKHFYDLISMKKENCMLFLNGYPLPIYIFYYEAIDKIRIIAKAQTQFYRNEFFKAQ
jgi:hypothetical protein